MVIHEIYGLTDWIRSLADQLAAEGYIAIAPDILTGKGPDGGGTESVERDGAGNRFLRALEGRDGANIRASKPGPRRWLQE